MFAKKFSHLEMHGTPGKPTQVTQLISI